MPGAISAKLHGEPKPRKGPKTPLTFIVTAYNIEDYIDRALSSVVDQAVEGAEIIVIDDGSADRTLSKITAFLKGEPKARIISQVNAGPGAARNVALSEATGDYILFLDGDDWLAPGAAKALLKAAAQEEGIDIVLSNRRRYWEATGRYDTRPNFKADVVGTPTEVAGLMSIMAIHGKMFRRRFLTDNRIAFPTGMTSEDFVFSYQTYGLAERVAAVRMVTYFYRKRVAGGGAITQGRLTEFNLNSRFRQIELTQALAEDLKMAAKFPQTDFVRADFQFRLMRHVTALPTASDAARDRGFEMIRAFLGRHRDKALTGVGDEARDIYRLILDGRDEEAMPLIAAARARIKSAEKEMRR